MTSAVLEEKKIRSANLSSRREKRRGRRGKLLTKGGRKGNNLRLSHHPLSFLARGGR